MSERPTLVTEVMRSATPATGPAGSSTRAVAYARVSTDLQEDKGLSMPAQLKAIEAYADDHGIEVLETFVEAASSFQDESKRVEFRRMLEMAKSNARVTVILVHDSSRFCRDPWRTPQIIGELQNDGVRVVSVTEPEYDVNTVMGMWMQKVTEAKNASYSMEVAFHTRKGMRQNASVRDPETGWCYKNGGKPPWGYRTFRIERTDIRGRPRYKAVWELDTTEVAGRPVWEWTREVLIRAAEGTSLDTLRDLLNEAGVTTARGGYWSTSTIHSLLEPHMLLQYAGYGTWNVRKKRREKWNRPEDWEVVPKAHPPIITEEESRTLLRARDQARQRHANPSTRMSGVRSSGSRFILSGGPFRCARCGSNMVGHTNRGRDGYICGAAKYRRGLGCGSSVFVEKHLVEDALWDTIRALAETADGDGREQLASDVNEELQRQWEAGGGSSAAAARSRLEKIDGKIGHLRMALEDGLCDVAWANGRLQALASERADILAECGGVVGPTEPPTVDGKALVTYLTDVSHALPHATNQEKRSVAGYLLDGVTLDPDARQIEIRVKLPANALQRVEAAAGVEPADKGFADLCLSHLATPPNEGWSGKRDSNPRPTAWEAVALPTELFPLLSLLV